MPRLHELFTNLRQQHLVTYLIWAMLAVCASVAMFSGRWSILFISIITFALTLIPILFQDWTGLRMPRGFVAGVISFIFSTVLLGEAYDFYERYWWWDVLLHTGSAVGFGMIGMVLVLFLVRGDKLNTSPVIAALFAFTFAVAIGAVWEIFEYLMDLMFGLGMQKSGLNDTMGDLMVDCIGALIGALGGYRYLRSKEDGPLTKVIAEFIKQNFKRGTEAQKPSTPPSSP